MRGYDVATLTKAPQQKRSHAQSLRILAAAEEILKTEGVAAFNVRAVAEKAEVSIGGIYRRFRDRDELLRAVHGHFMDRLEKRVREDLAACRTADLHEILRVFIGAVCVSIHEAQQLVIASQTIAPDPLHLRAVQGQAAMFEALRNKLDSEGPAIGRPQPEPALRFAFQMILGTLFRRLVFEPEFGVGFEDWTTVADELAIAAYRYLAPEGSR